VVARPAREVGEDAATGRRVTKAIRQLSAALRQSSGRWKERASRMASGIGRCACPVGMRLGGRVSWRVGRGCVAPVRGDRGTQRRMRASTPW